MTTQTSSPVDPAQPKASYRPQLLLILGIVLLMATLGIWYLLGLGTESTDDAYVDGNIVQVTSQVSGTVTVISGDNTDHVDAHSPLVTLNAVDAEIQFERAKSNLARAVRQARTQYYQVQQLEAEVSQRQNDVNKAQDDVRRRSQLAASGAVSREEISHAEEVLKNALAGLDGTRHALAVRLAMVDNTTLRTHPDVLVAAANLRDACIALHRSQIYSPVTGVITKRSVQVGQRINPGVALMSVVPIDLVWVNANFKESQIQDLRIGQPVVLRADAYSRKVIFHGSIVGLDAGTGSAFSLMPAQNATGNWIKVTQRVPVRIALQPQEIADNPLRLGLSMRVSVDTNDTSGQVLNKKTPAQPAYSTNIFENELKDANDVVEQVISANDDRGQYAKHLKP
ncbi:MULTISPECIES: HlyD family secretion protein [Gammaproteobacteria]|uniref:HlyD family secretion protein n=1 Tax=Gammaproteobacteria TaxID=1236 RepID=UPI001914AFDE|nr:MULTISPECIES: efflux RND transporter periplasmic adaptor subunit [Gammaproteobacteria]MBK5304494.1 efflux RND transporter periplasmic adaptor subunit [Bacillus sp. TH86]MBK5324263.1 efflux RND transporter periplasmic adaptor subunit [Bacillus sp. TH59]MBK5339213.1 efflux RND transporter periplasmic adaptor subunit [Bacillus sp. TH57]MBK5313261.1 efflux RND transporter periplasmic adaptor subunit [Pseudomonas sp. TH71]MBK5318760.1 efflux RND transporter periplasmic adaptor subunit [Erwinia s